MANSKQQRFLTAYAECHEPFVRYCSAVAYGVMSTDDLVQDVLLSAFKHFETINNKTPLLHYLIRAARNRQISQLRKRDRQPGVIDQQARQLASKEVSPDVILDIQLLYRYIAKLPTEQADALTLFEVSGFSMREIAELQASTVGATKTRISRARARLKQLLHEPKPATAAPKLSNP